MPLLDDSARSELAALQARGIRRSLEAQATRTGAEIELRPGERLLNFSSNDYLGLAGHPAIAAALAEGAARWGTGAGASRFVTGDFAPHRSLEEELARFEGTAQAVLFNSGYAANCGLLPALAGPGDLILSDELNHASLIDGCRLSRARVDVIAHADLGAFEAALRRRPGARRTLVVTDSIFSMDGDRAPLAELSQLCERHGAALLVDEAHATGVFGPRGEGLCHALGVAPDLRMATLSKAAGCVGAYVASTSAVCELLLNRARPLVFSTALPPALSCAALVAVRLLQDAAKERAQLWRNVARFAAGLRALGYAATEASPIFPIVLGSPERAVSVAAGLRARGVLIKAIRPPTVPEGTSRLRVALSAAHTDAHVDEALSALRACAA